QNRPAHSSHSSHNSPFCRQHRTFSLQHTLSIIATNFTMPRIPCPVCFKLHNESALPRHIECIHRNEVEARHSAEVHDVNTTSEIILGCEDQFGYPNDEWDGFG